MVCIIVSVFSERIFWPAVRQFSCCSYHQIWTFRKKSIKPESGLYDWAPRSDLSGIRGSSKHRFSSRPWQVCFVEQINAYKMKAIMWQYWKKTWSLTVICMKINKWMIDCLSYLIFFDGMVLGSNGFSPVCSLEEKWVLSDPSKLGTAYLRL